jgi:hypothetical protein
MTSYELFKLAHILTAFSLVGPLILTPKWLVFAHQDIGRTALQDLHRLTGISGWLVLLSGAIMLYLQHGSLLAYFWMKFSIVIFLIVQIIDHFWADPREERLEQGDSDSISSLKAWLSIKLGMYFLIAIFMVLKLQL